MELIADQVEELSPSAEPVEYAAPDAQEAPVVVEPDDYDDDDESHYETIRVRRDDPYGSLRDLANTDARWNNIITGLASRKVQQRATEAEKKLAAYEAAQKTQLQTSFEDEVRNMTQQQFWHKMQTEPPFRAKYERAVIARNESQRELEQQRNALPPHVERTLSKVAERLDAHQHIVPPERMAEYNQWLGSEEARAMDPEDLLAHLSTRFEDDKRALAVWRRQQKAQGQPAQAAAPVPRQAQQAPVQQAAPVTGNQRLANFQADTQTRRPSGLNRQTRVYSQTEWDDMGMRDMDSWQKQLKEWGGISAIEAHRLGYIQ